MTKTYYTSTMVTIIEGASMHQAALAPTHALLAFVTVSPEKFPLIIIYTLMIVLNTHLNHWKPLR